MTVIPIKALSVNQAWQGRRFKTKKYLKYERDLLLILPKIVKKYDKRPLKIAIEVGLSALQDLDGTLKCLLDVLQKKYDFNDRYIHEIHAGKVIVKKGHEFIAFEITVV